MMKFTRRQYFYLFGAGLSAASESPLAERWRQIAAETDGAIADEDWTAIIQATGAVSAKATTLRAMC